MFIQCCFYNYTLLSCTSFNTHLYMCIWIVLYIFIPCVLIWPPPGLRQSCSFTTEVMNDLTIVLSPALHKVFQDFYPIQLVMVSCSNTIGKERNPHIIVCKLYFFILKIIHWNTIGLRFYIVLIKNTWFRPWYMALYPSFSTCELSVPW